MASCSSRAIFASTWAVTSSQRCQAHPVLPSIFAAACTTIDARDSYLTSPSPRSAGPSYTFILGSHSPSCCNSHTSPQPSAQKAQHQPRCYHGHKLICLSLIFKKCFSRKLLIVTPSIAWPTFLRTCRTTARQPKHPGNTAHPGRSDWSLGPASSDNGTFCCKQPRIKRIARGLSGGLLKLQ